MYILIVENVAGDLQLSFAANVEYLLYIWYIESVSGIMQAHMDCMAPVITAKIIFTLHPARDGQEDIS